ncbi:hypothetical protein T459_05001 [Capsicum annuum]|uniref:Uncharacterized protein n=1 Tax=Capsicum annuum TaxID=4072 RepID=A0A2G3A6P9_CAPAN|nr:hypothetical protein T459_05001 [Capsicum annuum]
MRGKGQGRSGRGGAGCGCGHGSFPERLSFDRISQPQIQPIGVVGTSFKTRQSFNPSEGPLQTQQMQIGPIQRTSPETQSSRNLDESVRLSVEDETGAGEKDTPDKIWEIQHTRKNVNGERGQLQQLVVEQQSKKIELRMTGDEILSSVLGERSGYVRGKGHGKKPPKKNQTQQTNIEASVYSAVESIR